MTNCEALTGAYKRHYGRSKFFLLLVSYLFFFSNLFAQTDSNSAPVVKDTNAARLRAEPRNMEPAPGARTQDTGLPAPKRVLKRTPPAIAPGPATSLSSGASAIVPVPDSAPHGKDTAWRPATKENAADLANATGGGNTILAANPFFNFTGKPVVENEIIHRPNSRDSLFYLMLGILFYFALVRIFFEKYFGNLLTLFFRASIRQQQIREQVLQAPLPSLMLNGLFIITGGLYACYLLRYYQFAEGINFWLLYLNCMLALGAIYLVKFLVLKFCGWVFNISRATDTYIFVVFLVNKMLGIFLLPFLILITFSGQGTREIYVTISLAMVFIFLCYRVLTSFRPIRNEIKLTPFHFFLYLCAFEIAPLLLIYKVLLIYLEKAS